MTGILAGPGAAWMLACLPICLSVAYSDLREMRIPNVAVVALVGVFLILGLATLPLDAALIRLMQGAAVLVAGFVLTNLGLVGAGDSKWAAAMALYVAPGDALAFLQLFALVLILSWALHRLAARIGPLRRATAAWTSWDADKLFPMGVPLALSLILYLWLGSPVLA